LGAGGAAGVSPALARGGSGALSLRVGLKRFRSATALNAVSGGPGAVAASGAVTSAGAVEEDSVGGAGGRAVHAS
jgi:hypothetical protein